MIAGAFAFMPVQEASTVHTTAAMDGTVSDQVLNPFLVRTAAVATASGGQLTATFTCTAAESCVINDATVALTANPNATADIFYIESISVNGVKMTGADFASPTNDEFIVPNTSTVLGSPADIVTSTTAASNVPASVMSTVGATTGNSAYGGFTLDGGDTLVVVVQSSSGDTATSQITFYGSMTGSVAPATPTFA
jgi:hypothetical protein